MRHFTFFKAYLVSNDHFYVIKFNAILHGSQEAVASGVVDIIINK